MGTDYSQTIDDNEGMTDDIIFGQSAVLAGSDNLGISDAMLFTKITPYDANLKLGYDE